MRAPQAYPKMEPTDQTQEPKHRTTLRDIAKVAGVHFTTVGRALRGDSRVKSEVAEKVLAIAKRMNYQSDPLLSALSSYRNRNGTAYHGNIGYVFTHPVEEMASGARASYLAARQHAEEQGFAISPCVLEKGPNCAAQLRRVLRARGVQGVILSPLPNPGPYPDFHCDDLAVATIGQSITLPVFHRVCNHQFHSLRLQMYLLRERGYRRIGLVLSTNANSRTEGIFLGAYLAEQMNDAEAARVPPLIFDGAPIGRLVLWLKRHQPDCIIASEGETYDCLKQLGYSIPDNLGFSFLSRRDNYPEVAGAVESFEALGVLVVDLVISLMAKREYGIPKMPVTTLVENRNWDPAGTVRRLQAPV